MATTPRSKAQLYARLLELVPDEYHGAAPLLSASAEVLAASDTTMAALATASSPAASGRDLTLYVRGFNQRRQDGEEDAELRARALRFADRITRGAFLGAIESVLDEADFIFAEHHETMVFTDDDSEDYLRDFYTDLDILLGHELGIAIVVDDAMDADVLDRLVTALDFARIAGVTVYVVWDVGRDVVADWDLIQSYTPWQQPA